MSENKTSLTRRMARAGGWQVVKRFGKSIPIVGTALALGMVGYSIRKKGVVKGAIHTGLDVMPIVGTAKNVVELFTGDLIPDKKDSGKNKKR